ncbi:PREDICTED: probable serine/threonine-protein kinase DDB_G0280133 isoform X1 [Papilio xuthus]|uniref:Probable serine/threonine-protein kinase DDB_G0280133 isoform X1 n=1 Tax=Papilio xuthus TaxID=66420 RepID=A0AAJ6ZIS0_PAPXU|nr:PREDICTED: probable serine/threonine-protein kinase DDB_G0280133 isoform X1 [Papilio xuthus]
MKSKKRHYSSSEDTDESNASDKSSSSSDSESEDSSVSEHRGKKKRKRANSTESDSHSDNQKRPKKRKHKKKKKKHGKKKKRSDSADRGNVESISSLSDGEITSKKKRKQKHKHSKRAESVHSEEEQPEHRLHSVVKECRQSSDEGSQPPRTYYQKDYPMRHSESADNYERQCEVQRFYRGSSKEHSSYQESYGYDRGHNERVYDKSRERYGHNPHYAPNEYNKRPKEFDEYKRHPRFEEHRPDEDFHRRPRDEPYQGREDSRGYNRYNNQYDHRGAPKQREVHEVRDYRDRRGPPDVERYREREYAEKRDKYREERYSGDRNREFRRERPPRVEKPSSPHHREHSKSRSPERYRDKNLKAENREERDGGREGRPVKERLEKRDSSRGGEERRDRPRRSEERPRPTENESRPRERKSRFADADDKKEYGWGKTEVKKEGKPEGEKEKPDFGLSGKLTADANTVNGVVIKYAEPDDAKQPKRRWRFYPFKGDKALPILYIHRQSCFLIGRDKKVVDIALEHPSISKQHAALQYRATPFARPDGSQGRRVRPYVIDLESANGTFVNNKKIEPRRYVELLERDVVKFGFSQREYVLLHENSKDDAQDDDNQDPPAVTTTDHIKHEKRIKEEVAADGD